MLMGSMGGRWGVSERLRVNGWTLWVGMLNVDVSVGVTTGFVSNLD